MENLPPCPACSSIYTYEMEDKFVCPECSFEWKAEAIEVTDSGIEVKDANGNILVDGDSVVVIKNLPVKGAAHPIKAGTKVKNIRLTE